MDNYQTRVTPAKEDAVKALKEEFEGYNGFIFTDYRGMTVAQITELRNTLRKNDAQYRVVKNRYAKIAFRNLGKDGADDQMVGPTAVALAKGDESNVVAKALFEAIKNGVPMQVNNMATKEEILESIAQMSVMDVADLIKMMEEKFGVQAAAAAVAVVGGAAGGDAPAEEEQTEFNVTLKSVDAAKKIACIKEVRAITGLGLKEAKDLCENGGMIKEAVSKEEAASIKEKLEAAGCVVEVK